MTKRKKTTKAEVYSSDLLNDLVSQITSEEQTLTDRKMLLAAKIFDAMKKKGWNQTEFARQMGKQPSEISKWLSGTHTFNSDTLWAISDKLGIELLPVFEVPKVTVVKYVPIVVPAEMAQVEESIFMSCFGNTAPSQEEGYSLLKKYVANNPAGITKESFTYGAS